MLQLLLLFGKVKKIQLELKCKYEEKSREGQGLLGRVRAAPWDFLFLPCPALPAIGKPLPLLLGLPQYDQGAECMVVVGTLHT